MVPVTHEKKPAAALRRRHWLAMGALAALTLLFAGNWLRDDAVPPAPPSGLKAAAAPAVAVHSGSAACAQCHAAESQAWAGSHHAAALAEASETSVLGDFSDSRFEEAGVLSRFSRRDGGFFVTTDGPDGKSAEFRIKYSFGITPLQQYLVEFPDGRVQALGVAWDTRAREQGGQRWFHLYPGQKIPHDDPLHWTGLQQNWNFMCADCHSTALRKNYDASAARFRTAWSEISVGCEACHGPASNHLAWARQEGEWQRLDNGAKGLVVSYAERKGAAWLMDPAKGSAARSRPRPGATEVDTCAQCHARRAQFGEDYAPGRPLGDAYRVSLLEEGLYWPDGQMRDEVYNHGSFLQSRMYSAGVSCADCHEPHSGKLRLEGNAVCGQCHLPAKYDQPQHHHHPVASAGAQCAACHMPTTTYMGVDARHDHSLRVPRPDLSVRLGTPNACTACHADRKPEWAAAAVQGWYGHVPAGFQDFAEAFAEADAHGAGAGDKLRAIAARPSEPAIVRASALARLAADPVPEALELAVRALEDPDELVRRAAVELLAVGDPRVMALHLPRLLDDPVRVVRISAARALAAMPAQALAPDRLAARTRALAEWEAAQHYNADRPESLLNLGSLHVELGDLARAEAEYQRVLERYPGSVQASINLADLYRARGDEARAVATLEEALRLDPEAAAAHHALGLALVRRGDREASLRHLSESVRLAPEVPRYAYVLGVAQHSYGEVKQGIATLEQAHARFGSDRSILQALASMQTGAGNPAAARDYAQKLLLLSPGDPQVQAMLQSLPR